LRVFFDADVLISAATPESPVSAAHILVQLSALTLVDGVTTPYARDQAERNIKKKLPGALRDFHELLENAVRVVSDVSQKELSDFAGYAEEQDIPILAGAMLHHCRFLVTRNVSDYYKTPKKLEVIGPGDLVKLAREALLHL
jgi:hypothetical protein